MMRSVLLLALVFLAACSVEPSGMRRLVFKDTPGVPWEGKIYEAPPRVDVKISHRRHIALNKEKSPNPTLSWPMTCSKMEDCYIGGYPDHLAGHMRSDYRGGGLVGENETRATHICMMPAREQTNGALVLAAAPGKVTRIDIEAPNGDRCAPSVTVDHGYGWTSRYCGLKKTDIRVRPEEVLARSAVLGSLPQKKKLTPSCLRFALFKEKRYFDPFGGNYLTAPNADPLWADSVQKQHDYRPVMLTASGFTETEPKIWNDWPKDPSATWENLVFWGRLIGAKNGDKLTMRFSDPAGKYIVEEVRALHKTDAVTPVVLTLPRERVLDLDLPSSVTFALEIKRDGRVLFTHEDRLDITQIPESMRPLRLTVDRDEKEKSPLDKIIDRNQ